MKSRVQFKFPTPKAWGSNSPPPGRLIIKFPPPRDGKGVKCPGYARGGGHVEASIWPIHNNKNNGLLVFPAFALFSHPIRLPFLPQLSVTSKNIRLIKLLVLTNFTFRDCCFWLLVKLSFSTEAQYFFYQECRASIIFGGGRFRVIEQFAFSAQSSVAFLIYK